MVKPISLTLAICLIVTCGAAWGDAEQQKPKDPSVTFTFAPPAPLTYTEQTTSVRIMVAGGPEPIEETGVSKVKMTITKADGGYRVVAEPVSFELTRAGKPVKDPVMEAVQSVTVTYRLGSDGSLKTIEGLGSALPAAMKKAPKELQNTLSALFNEKTLIEREKGQWNSRLGDFLGRVGHKNSVWISLGMFPMPNGTQASYYIVALFMGMVKQDGRDLVKLKLMFTEDASRIPTLVNDTVRDVVPDLPKPPVIQTVKGFSITGSGERLIDPSTMLIYAEKSSRDMQWIMPAGKDSSMPVLLQETGESRFSYSPAPGS